MKWLVLLCLNWIVVPVSHPFKTVIYYELNINSHLCPNACKLQYVRQKAMLVFHSLQPMFAHWTDSVFKVFSHSLCCFISLINVFLMTVCVCEWSIQLSELQHHRLCWTREMRERRMDCASGLKTLHFPAEVLLLQQAKFSSGIALTRLTPLVNWLTSLSFVSGWAHGFNLNYAVQLKSFIIFYFFLSLT